MASRPSSQHTAKLMAELTSASEEYYWQEYSGGGSAYTEAERRYEDAKAALITYITDLEDRPPL